MARSHRDSLRIEGPSSTPVGFIDNFGLLTRLQWAGIDEHSYYPASRVVAADFESIVGIPNP